MDSVQSVPTNQPPAKNFTATIKKQTNNNGSFSIKKILVLSGIVLAFMLFWNWLNSPMLVTVTGTGEVTVSAESATLSFIISSTDASPTNAISSTTSKTENFRDTLKNFGIAEEDIVESQIEVLPTSTDGTSLSYQATITMGAKTVHTESVTNLISTLYSNGAILVSQPIVSVEEQDVLEQQAIDEAMKDAKKQAGKIALKNWKIVKKIVAVAQASSGAASTTTSKADTLTQVENPEAAQSDVFKIVKAVSVTYKMW